MQFSQDQHEPLRLDAFVIVVEWIAGAQLLQHVIHLREGEAGEGCLPRLAMGVEFLRDLADFGFEGVIAVGKGERVEAARFDVDAVVPDAEPASCSDCPSDVWA